jgi:hyaluronoglucosaminidase
MKLKHLLLTALLFSFANPGSAQNNNYPIYPSPQKISHGEQKISTDVSYQLEGNFKLKPNSLALLNEIFNNQTKSKGFSIIINSLAKTDKSLQISGAYTLKITPQAIQIGVFDNRGAYYALQTLNQLKKANSLPLIEITDFPDVLSRGSVEGFYGTPWSHEDRISQFKFYGALKLNTYIYGPKDDPYHSSPNWRKPYPAENAKQIQELVQEAKKNEIDFTWAIHPGLDIQWNKADSLAILNKFELMYDLGVRSYAVFFDDISGIGTKAEKQAELLNYLQKQFIEKKKDVLPLIMCPTEYNKAWSDPNPGTYLDILGDKLHPAIEIMWTGDRVIDDVSKADLDWINKRIKRKAYIWWNFPVSDYVRDHLLMGAAYGLDTTIKNDLSGFVSNPMERAEASKLALFSVALYTWNLKKYEPKTAWHEASKYIMPEATEAFQLFNEHNSDLGPNGHRYRREESVLIKPTIDSFLAAYNSDNYPAALGSKIKTEFERIIPVAEELRTKSRNINLIKEIDPWLTQFNLLGKAGLETINMLDAKQAKTKALAWDHYLKVEAILDSINLVDKTFNQNPYQPGVKTASLVLTPFVKTVFEQTKGYFVATSENIEKISTTNLISNAEKLKNQPLQLNNTYIAISPILEVLNLKPQEYVGIQIDKNLKLKELYFNLESNNLLEGGAFETSIDAKTWQPLKVEQNRGKGNITLTDDAIKHIRFKNTSDKIKSFFLKEFKVILATQNANSDQSIYVKDNSIATYLERNDTSEISLPISVTKLTKSIVLLVKNQNKTIAVYAVNKRGTKTLVYSGQENFIEIPAKQFKKATTLEVKSENNKGFRIYEILKN